MKKTLLAIAVLGACAMTAQAANVTLYGGVDGGFVYTSAKTTVHGQQIGEKESSFKLGDGILGSNKVGIKGEEDLGNMKVGFKLENGFHIANGAMKSGGTLFDREARMYVKGAFGEVAAGRFGGLASAAGTYDLFFGNADAFDGGDNDIPFAFAKSDRYNNSLAYQTPEFAGVQGTLMYSFNKKDAQENKFKDNDRYIGAGLTYTQDKFALVGVVESQLRPSAQKNAYYKNGLTFSFGGNYDFGAAKLFAGAQVARNTRFGDIQHGFDLSSVAENLASNEKVVKAAVKEANDFAAQLKKNYDAIKGDKEKKAVFDTQIKAANETLAKTFGEHAVTLDPNTATIANIETNMPGIIKDVGALAENVQFNGYALTLGSQIPFGANTVTVAGYYGNYKNAFGVPQVVAKKAVKLQTYGLSARYEYALSKRTTIGAGAGIGQSKIKFAGENAKSKIAQVYAALHHNF